MASDDGGWGDFTKGAPTPNYAVLMGRVFGLAVILAAITVASFALHSTHQLRAQQRGIRANAARLQRQQVALRRQEVALRKQERLTCNGNRVLYDLLVGGRARSEKALKVDSPSRKAIDRSGIAQLNRLISAYKPATGYCEASKVKPKAVRQ